MTHSKTKICLQCEAVLEYIKKFQSDYASDNSDSKYIMNGANRVLIEIKKIIRHSNE